MTKARPMVQTIDQDWPTTDLAGRYTTRRRPRGAALAQLWVVMFLLVASPTAAWMWAALPGHHPWAPVVWPAGWLVAFATFCITGYLNTRRGNR